jgi:hypothetical protein
MNAAEVVVREEQRDSRLMIPPQLGMPIGQAREPTYLHPDCFIMPFNETG